jgi:prefoldin subunit 5
MVRRLEELRQELAKGQKRLEMLERERQEVRDTMLRISGAIQVLEELVKQEEEQKPVEAIMECAR